MAYVGKVITDFPIAPEIHALHRGLILVDTFHILNLLIESDCANIFKEKLARGPLRLFFTASNP